MSNIERWECGRCGAEVREGKRTHFCGEPYPLKVTDDIRVVEYVPAEQLRGAVEALEQIAAKVPSDGQGGEMVVRVSAARACEIATAAVACLGGQ